MENPLFDDPDPLQNPPHEGGPKTEDHSFHFRQFGHDSFSAPF
jgi:hypothetical protein